MKDVAANLASKAFTPLQICYDLLIHTGCCVQRCKAFLANISDETNHTVWGVKNNPTDRVDSGERVYILVCCLWNSGVGIIHDMRAVNTDYPSYTLWVLEKVISSSEKENNKKYMETFIEQQRHISPFSCSVYGLLGNESYARLKRLASCIA